MEGGRLQKMEKYNPHPHTLFRGHIPRRWEIIIIKIKKLKHRNKQ